MSEPTNEELREMCQIKIASCYEPPADCGSETHHIARALLSRLDREAEAERRIDLLLEANGKLGNQVLELSEEVNARGGLLKVAREAIESAAHAINCDYLSPIHTVCGHPANSRKHAGACDADWIPPAELKQRDCSCWKARALAEIAPAAPDGEKP